MPLYTTQRQFLQRKSSGKGGQITSSGKVLHRGGAPLIERQFAFKRERAALIRLNPGPGRDSPGTLSLSLPLSISLCLSLPLPLPLCLARSLSLPPSPSLCFSLSLAFSLSLPDLPEVPPMPTPPGLVNLHAPSRGSRFLTRRSQALR